MNRKQLERWAYSKPKCKKISTDTELFICASVTPNSQLSHEQPWDGEQIHKGGSIFIGDESTVAPAKGGGLWEEEEEEF